MLKVEGKVEMLLPRFFYFNITLGQECIMRVNFMRVESYAKRKEGKWRGREMERKKNRMRGREREEGKKMVS